MRTLTALRRGSLIAATVLAALLWAAPAGARTDGVEVVVMLARPSLTDVPRPYLARPDSTPVDVRSANAHAYIRSLAQTQEQVERRILRAIPSAEVRWRYRIVLDGLAVVVPRAALPRLSRIPGVASVTPGIGYRASRAQLNGSVPLIGAPQLWGPSFASAGQGIKIGIIDDGVDFTHPFFAGTGYVYPPGYPKGDVRYTSPKVIVARTFSSRSPLAVHRGVPFDPENSEHATHVAGIAAGDDGTVANVAGATTVAGVAPRAYLGNYKVMSVPTPQFGIDGNSPEIAAAIEAAVADGMNVINLSLGEPEVTPTRDIVVRAIDAAAKARVVTAVAAGNEFGEYGDGSVDSPGSAPSAITVAASGTARSGSLDEIADFSSAGPTPVSLQLKPDVSAPGVSILSSLPARDNFWGVWNGTSMASPHVAGAVALLLQRHPTWTAAQVKSALVLTGRPVYPDGSRAREVSPLRQGGGRVDLVAADTPLVFAAPTNAAFGLVKPAARVAPKTLRLDDAGGGAGSWSVTLKPITTVAGARIDIPAQVAVPGTLQVGATVGQAAAEGDLAGFVVLRNPSGVTRRIPYWLHVERPRLATEAHRILSRPGNYTGTTSGKPARVTQYRYPTKAQGELQSFAGPEQVFRFTIRKPVANAGVVVTAAGPGVSVSPHVVVAGDENRLTGFAGLPINIDPYQSTYGTDEHVAAVDLPAVGTYDAVFDTASRAAAGLFRFHFWVDDRRPPTVRLVTPKPAHGKPILARITDAGSGVDPNNLTVSIDGRSIAHTFANGILRILTDGLASGKHAISIRAADYQESKNMENTGAILPNTRFFTASVTLGG